jgi:plastocyanin
MRSALTASLFIVAVATAAVAGTIEGKVPPNSVVYVDAVPGKTFPAPAQELTMGQQGLAFNPHILAIQQGTTVEFQNNDNVQHNIFWPSVGGNKKEVHNLGTWPKGERRSFKFDRPGVVPLLCNVHPEMSGYVVVSPTPYFSQSNASGDFKIENVPDGKYTIVAWHEGGKAQTKVVEVAGNTKADFTSSK